MDAAAAYLRIRAALRYTRSLVRHAGCGRRLRSRRLRICGWLAGWLAGAGKSAAGLYRQVSRAPDRCVQHPVQPRETAMSPDMGGEGAFR